MNEFIENVLDIKKYEIFYFKNGKNNITAKVGCKKGLFVIQEESSIFQDVRNENNIIDFSINHFVSNGIKLAGNFFDKRFFNYKNKIYQVMEYVDGNILDHEEIKQKTIVSMSKFLAHFHNISEYSNYISKQGEKTYKSNSILLDYAYKISIKNNSYIDLFDKIELKTNEVGIDLNLRKGIIHGDPAYKNFLFNNDGEVVSLVDYEKMEYNVLLWDLVDLIRSLLKLKQFEKKEFDLLIKSYEEIRKLTSLEKENLEGYLKLMILNTTTQYFLALFKNSGYNNNTGDIKDTLSKIERGFSELEKIKLFF